MQNVYIERFVRVPHGLVESLLPLRLSGLEWRVILWVLRSTLGWNRHRAAFTWYAIAQDLRADRSAVLRAGRRLIRSGVLLHVEGKLAAVMPESVAMGAARHRSLGPGGANWHRNRSQTAPLFRRVKDSSKENNIKGHPAGAARPIPGKYEPLQQ